MSIQQIIIELTDEEIKAAQVEIEDIQAWVQHAAKEKCRKCILRIVKKHSDTNPDKMTPTDKSEWIKNATLETRIERNTREKEENKPK